MPLPGGSDPRVMFPSEFNLALYPFSLSFKVNLYHLGLKKMYYVLSHVCFKSEINSMFLYMVVLNLLLYHFTS